jgi:16S rRNA (cytosine1402-N4)-methyltransferase
MSHISVLLNESIDGLAIQPCDIFVDGTLGDAGHTIEVLKRFPGDVTVVGIDKDADSLARVEKKFEEIFSSASKKPKVFLQQGNFKNCNSMLSQLGFEKADRFLFDIGMSSRQIDESGRGFSFRRDEPLIMTFENPENEIVGDEKSKSNVSSEMVTAKAVVNEWQEDTLVDILAGFGEERFAKRIARGIVEARKVKPIETTTDLVNIILASTPKSYHHGKIHPATRTFQAIRIAVNGELDAITEGLKNAWRVLSPKGRIAVISFHSLEDRIVKQYFNELKKEGVGKVITKKPITASDEEIKANPRSRSAKLRIIEKIS